MVPSSMQGCFRRPTALVNEAWLGLVGGQNPHSSIACISSAPLPMRCSTTGGGYRREDFEDFNRASPSADDQVLPMNEELDKLALGH